MCVGIGGSGAYPAQRSLARRRVILSRRVIAYYDLIRGSGPLSSAVLFGRRRVFAALAKAQSVPAFVCMSFLPCRLPYPGGWTELTVGALPSTLAFALLSEAWHPQFFRAEVGSRAVSLSGLQSSLYAAARRVARPSPTRTFTFELSCHGSPCWHVEYNYAGKQSIPATGLSPAGHAALQAARQNWRVEQRRAYV